MEIGERFPERVTRTTAEPPVTPATGYSLSGPTGGLNAAVSTPFTVALTPPGGAVTGTVTVTPSDGGAGGTFTPSTVGLTTASPSATFTYTPASAGSKTISTANNGGLTNPASLAYEVTAPFSPTDLAGLQGWWKGDSITGLADGAPLVTCPDSSGNGKTMTGGCAGVGATAPLYRPAGVNGKPALEFALSRACEIAGGGIGQNAPWTEVVVMKGVAGQPLYGLQLTSGYGSIGLGIAGGQWQFGANQYRWHAGAADTNSHVVSAVIDSPFIAGGNRCWVDAQQFASGAPVTGVDQSNFGRVGAFAGGNFGQGLVAEILHYNVALNDTDRTKVEDYLKDKYAITFPPPFIPTQITGLKGWWAADSLALADGTPVDLLPDSSGLGNNATQTGAARPTFTANVIQRDVKLRRLIPLMLLSTGEIIPTDTYGEDAPELFTLGKPVLRFTSAAFSSLIIPTGIPDTTWTVIAVIRNNAGIAVTVGSEAGFGTVGPFWGFGSWQMGTQGYGYATTGINTDTLFRVVSTDTSHTSIWLNEAAQAVATPTGYGGGPTLNRIGQRHQHFSDADIAEVLIYDSVLSDANRKKVENYLRCKYGL